MEAGRKDPPPSDKGSTALSKCPYLQRSRKKRQKNHEKRQKKNQGEACPIQDISGSSSSNQTTRGTTRIKSKTKAGERAFRRNASHRGKAGGTT